ncbi:MAG: AAA family ATPase [Planctomycetes bacterium]|nr:AAA family ATPase [Planctomycetota bacterium]
MHSHSTPASITPLPDTATVVDFLRQTGAYPESTRHVEVVETHISWIFLTDRFAYKLKKPVRFEFADMSTLAARRDACHEEVRLNRRLAADVYLKVLPVTIAAHGRLALGGTATPVDWVVKMRRLSADQTLDRLIRDNRLSTDQIHLIALMLADFYTQAAPKIVLPEPYHAGIERHVQANAAELARPEHAADPTQVRRIHAAQLRYLRLQRAVFDSRVCDGRIVEGHGDLRPEHIYFEGQRPLVIDCVEFSAELRTLDVADDLSFLAMECDRIGAEQVGRSVIDAYRCRSGDLIPDALLAFYMAYRACVRAKVAALRGRQLSPAERGPTATLLAEYLALADNYIRRLGPPLVVVMHGLMGTGKSTLASALSETLALEVLSTDVVRHELFSRAAQSAGYNEGNYAPQFRARVYDELLSRARQHLERGMSVILDGAFLSEDRRRAAFKLAEQAGAAALLIRCHCDPAEAKQRIAARIEAGQSPSEARPEFFTAQEREDEPSSGWPHVSIDTTMSLSEQIDTVFQHLTIASARKAN